MDISVVDGIIVAIIAGAALLGYNKGFIKSAGRIVSFVLGIVAAWVFCMPAVDYAEKHFGWITTLAKKFDQWLPALRFDDLMGIDSVLFNVSQYAHQGLSLYAARLLLSAVMFFVILLVASKLLELLVHLVGMVFNWGLLGVGNRVAGAAFEIAKAFLLLSVIVGLGMPICRLFSTGGKFVSMNTMTRLEASILVPYLERLFRFMGDIAGFF